MARFLFSTILLNDLGVPSRSLPIALELKRRGHTVAFCNPLDAPAKLIERAGLDNLSLDVSTRPTVRPTCHAGTLELRPSDVLDRAP